MRLVSELNSRTMGANVIISSQVWQHVWARNQSEMSAFGAGRRRSSSANAGTKSIPMATAW
jgi:hypothetical protein